MTQPSPTAGADLPAPLTPPDCDLRGYEFMPLFGVKLFGSEFYARASDAEFRAAVHLWWSAWQQCPAGSLPDDDLALCRFADLGRDLKRWKAIKAAALHGFIRCSDGRLYHPLLAAQALEAFQRRIREREKKRRLRARGEGHPPTDERPPETGQEPGQGPASPACPSGQEGSSPVPAPGQAAVSPAPQQGHPPGRAEDVPPDRTGEDRTLTEEGINQLLDQAAAGARVDREVRHVANVLTLRKGGSRPEARAGEAFRVAAERTRPLPRPAHLTPEQLAVARGRRAG